MESTLDFIFSSFKCDATSQVTFYDNISDHAAVETRIEINALSSTLKNGKIEQDCIKIPAKDKCMLVCKLSE